MITDFFLADLASTLKMSLTRKQGDAIRLLIGECESNHITDLRQIAYLLATVWHESRFQPIREIRAKRGTKLYLIQNRYWFTGYYGRGFVQITWKKNYAKFSSLVGVDLAKFPDKALEIEIAAKIAVIGMKFGMFTGVSLSTYFVEDVQYEDVLKQYFNARRIINGLDQAAKIALAAQKIEGVLKKFSV